MLYIFVYIPLVTIITPNHIFKVSLKDRKKIGRYHKKTPVILTLLFNLSLILPISWWLLFTDTSVAENASTFFVIFIYSALLINITTFIAGVYILVVLYQSPTVWEDILDTPEKEAL